MLSCGPDLFYFFEKELIELSKNIEKTLKSVIDKDNQFVFSFFDVR